MNRTRIEIVCAIVAFVVAIFAIHQWGEDKASLAAAMQAKASAQKVIAEQQKTIDGLEKGIQARDAQAAVEVAKYEPMRHVKTAKAAAAALPELVILPVQPKEVTKEELASAPSTVAVAGDYVWKPEAMIANTQRLAECKQNDILLTACKADMKDLRGELVATNLKFEAEVDVAKKFEEAAKGGTRLHRVFKVLKPIGCAAAGAAAGSLTKNKPIGAAVGAGAGGIFCALF